MKLSKVVATATALLVGAVSAFSVKDGVNMHSYFHIDGWEQHPKVPASTGLGNSTFQQLIDHDNPRLGSFSQFYYYSAEFYKGPGSPVILFTPGEINATGYQSYTTLNRTTGVLAKEIGAAVIVLEHRYWGNSSPFAKLSTKNLQYLTLKNSIADLNYFAKNVKLPFDSKRTSRPSRAPWLLMGGSYSGALSAWTASTAPGTFWAYHASSAPVQALVDYWAYFAPVQLGMPRNCSADVSRVVDHIDQVLTTGSARDKLALKTKFGLQDVKHDDDFAAALENGPWLWQGNQFYQSRGFYEFCDAVENARAGDKLPGPDGVGLDKALAGYASWFKGTLLPGFCEGYGYFTGNTSVGCFDTYSPDNPMFTDMTLSNTVDRQWVYMTCAQGFGYFQTGAPKGRPSLVSRLSSYKYWKRQCDLFFPPEGGLTYQNSPGSLTEQQVNAYTKGWDFTDSKRLLWVNGQYDPWRDSGVSSDQRPGGPLKSTKDVPVVIVPGGFHVSDLVTRNADVNPGVKKAVDLIIGQMKTWTAEFYARPYAE